MKPNVFLLIPFLLIACEKDFEFEKADKEPAKGTQVKELFQEDFKVSIEPDAGANKYWLRISWPKSSGSIVALENSKRIFKSSGNAYKYEKLYTGGEKFELSLFQEDSEEPSLVKQIEIPEDLVISQSKVLSGDLVFKGGRFFLNGALKIQSSSYNINIEADEFISENAMIETFPSGQKANRETNGRSGGNISIRTSKATGKLFVILRGEDGGDGRSSSCMKHFGYLCNAAGAGDGGNYGNFSFDSKDSRNFEVTVERFPGFGGEGGISCLYQHGTSTAHMALDSYINPSNACAPVGRGSSSGRNGISGTGEVCLKLKEEDKNVCE